MSVRFQSLFHPSSVQFKLGVESASWFCRVSPVPLSLDRWIRPFRFGGMSLDVKLPSPWRLSGIGLLVLPSEPRCQIETVPRAKCQGPNYATRDSRRMLPQTANCPSSAPLCPWWRSSGQHSKLNALYSFFFTRRQAAT